MISVCQNTPVQMGIFHYENRLAIKKSALLLSAFERKETAKGDYCNSCTVGMYFLQQYEIQVLWNN